MSGSDVLNLIIGVGTVGAVGAIAPPLFSEDLALFPRADIIAASLHYQIHVYSLKFGWAALPTPFLAHAPAYDKLGQFSTPNSNYLPTPMLMAGSSLLDCIPTSIWRVHSKPWCTDLLMAGNPKF